MGVCAFHPNELTFSLKQALRDTRFVEDSFGRFYQLSAQLLTASSERVQETQTFAFATLGVSPSRFADGIISLAHYLAHRVVLGKSEFGCIQEIGQLYGAVLSSWIPILEDRRSSSHLVMVSSLFPLFFQL
jgi:hypothetical protein